MNKVLIGVVGLLFIAGIGIYMLNEKTVGVSKQGSDTQVMTFEDKQNIAKERSKVTFKELTEKKDGNELELNMFNTVLELKENKFESVIFEYHIKNQGEQDITLQYSTSQTYDYEIYNKNDELVMRFSNGKSFLQVLKDVTISPNDSITYDINIPQLDKGEYKIIVWITAKGMALQKEEKTFSIN